MEPRETIDFEYALTFEDGEVIHVTARLDGEDLSLRSSSDVPPPDWARVERIGCEECPLRQRPAAVCPVAAALAALVARFAHRLSHEPVRLEVRGPERTYCGTAPLQRALSSLTGIYMVSAGCPIFDKLRPMVRFHLPLASEDETVFRAVGMYFIAQYLVERQGGAPDWRLDGLVQLYRHVHRANCRIAAAIRDAAALDASANALVCLDLFTSDVEWSVRDSLSDLARLFANSDL